MNKALLAWYMIVLLLPAGRAAAQLPLVRGNSVAASGMLYYDVHDADDLQARTYLYTLCPREAVCMSLDFTLVEGPEGRDFIRVFDGPDRDAPVLATLGGKSGSMFLQGRSGCLTFEFTRAEYGLQTVWTALWRSGKESDCIDPGRQSPGSLFQDICGPEYRENRPLWSGAEGGSVRPDSYTYRLIAARDGLLNFTLLPDNRLDDYDWELYTFHAGDTTEDAGGPRPARSRTIAANFSAGGGPAGATGMTDRGITVQASTGTAMSPQAGFANPFCHQVRFAKGREYFLKVRAGSPYCGGFRLLFNEAVLQCDQPVGELIQVAHEVVPDELNVPHRDAFTRNTQIWRLDLAARANSGLSSAKIEQDAWADLVATSSKPMGFGAMPETEGLVGALLLGLRSGFLRAYAADDFRTPLHYGDLLDLAYRIQLPPKQDSLEAGTPLPAPRGDWWRPDAGQLSGFENVVELIVDEVFDRASGRKKIRIRYLRLIWSDWEGEQPDYNVALFRYADLLPLLSRVRVTDFRNQALTTTLQDVFDGLQFEYLTVWKSGRSALSPAEGSHLKSRGQEMQSYHWQR